MAKSEFQISKELLAESIKLLAKAKADEAKVEERIKKLTKEYEAKMIQLNIDLRIASDETRRAIGRNELSQRYYDRDLAAKG